MRAFRKAPQKWGKKCKPQDTHQDLIYNLAQYPNCIDEKNDVQRKYYLYMVLPELFSVT